MDSFHRFVEEFAATIALFQKNLPFVLSLIAGLYFIHFLNFILGYRLNLLGIYPRRIFGLVGIFFSPFLHGNFNHLFFNSIPLFVLLSFVLLSGLPAFYVITATIILLGGLGTWLFGRSALHIGASGLIMGYWSYLLLNGYQQGSSMAIGLALVCIYYFGGLLFNLFPLEAKSSFEAHIFGFFAGLAANFTTPYLLKYLAAQGYFV